MPRIGSTLKSDLDEADKGSEQVLEALRSEEKISNKSKVM
tara:strand:- start:24 stop:143 length:120 start_codon:yes stop_codon:yes gene_type:complete